MTDHESTEGLAFATLVELDNAESQAN